MMKPAAALKLLKSATSKSGIPILTHVRLSPKEAMTTDLETSVAVDTNLLGIEVEGEGCAPFSYLEKALKAGAQKLRFTKDTMHWERGKTVTLPVADWPKVSFPAGKVPMSDSFLDAFGIVGCAMTPDHALYSLDGANLEPDGTLCASDSHRMYVADSGLADALKVAVTLPASLLRILPAGLKRFGLDQPFVAFHGEGFSLSSRLLEGTFPDRHKVIPQGTMPLELAYDADKLLAGLKRLKGFCPQGNKPHQPIGLSMKSGQLHLHYDREGSEAWEDVPVSTTSSPLPKPISLNLAYLLDAVRVLGSGTMGLGNEWTVVRLQSERGTAVIMPIHI